MNIIADLQIHSRFSRAVSKQMTTPFIFAWAQKKGIDLIATGDWNHPMWMREIQEHLEETGKGTLKLNSKFQMTNAKSSLTVKITHNSSRITHNDPEFLLATEVSCIYTQGGKGRRIHILIWVPTLKSALAINKEMTKRGCNLLSDGRPIIGLTAINVAELVLSIEPKALVIPAHAWTPWFSLYGSMSGFNSIDEAFGPFAKHIHAIETGLSSSPDMNWRIKELDDRKILSFSDSHSGPKLGREATVFEIPEISYQNIYNAIVDTKSEQDENSFDPQLTHEKTKQNNMLTSHSLEMRSSRILSSSDIPAISTKKKSHSRILYTIEFYPEEGKYHYSGHRTCGIRLTPEESRNKGTICSVCGKKLTQGVMTRVDELAARSEKDLKLQVIPLDSKITPIDQVYATQSGTFSDRPPFVMLVPLQEIIAKSIGSPVTSNKVVRLYEPLIATFGNEFTILLKTSIAEISRIAGTRIGEGVQKVRQRKIHIDPGYDGVFGKVELWEKSGVSHVFQSLGNQKTLFE
jgi:PHP family Zn ribbon phosphoesterase